MTILINPPPLKPLRSTEQIVIDCLETAKSGNEIEVWMVKELVNWRHPMGNDRVCEVVALMAHMLADKKPWPRPTLEAFSVSTAIMSAISRASDLAVQSGASFTNTDVRVVVERVLKENRVCR